MTSSVPGAQIHSTNSYTMIGNTKPSPLGAVDTPISLPEATERHMDHSSTKKLPSILGDEMRNTENAVRSEMEHIIERWSEKMKYFEIQLKEIN